MRLEIYVSSAEVIWRHSLNTKILKAFNSYYYLMICSRIRIPPTGSDYIENGGSGMQLVLVNYD